MFRIAGLLGGTALGYACLVRSPSVLALLPLILYLWSITRGQAKPKRALAGFGLAFGTLALAILIDNQLNHGGF